MFMASQKSKHIAVRTILDDEHRLFGIADATEQTDDVRVITKLFHKVDFVEEIRFIIRVGMRR